MEDVNQLVAYMQEQRNRLNMLKDTLDLDAPAKARAAKRNTLPNPRTPEQLLIEARFKARWRGSGSQNEEFSRPSILPPKVLSPWEQERALAPERIRAPRGSKPIKVSYTGREFGDSIDVPLPPRFKATLERNMEKFKDIVQNPHKYVKPEPVPSILHPRGFTPTTTIGSDFRFAHTHMMPRTQSMKQVKTTK